MKKMICSLVAVDEDYGVDVEDLDYGTETDSERTDWNVYDCNKRKIAKESRLRLADIYAIEGDNVNAKTVSSIIRS